MKVSCEDLSCQLRQRPWTASSVSSQLMLQPFWECCGLEVWMQDVQRSLHHPTHQELTGGTARDIVRSGPVLKQYPGNPLPEITNLAFFELFLHCLHHPLGSTI